MQDNKLGAYSIFKALKHQLYTCNDDEKAGMTEMLNYYWYLLRNNPQRNLELENEVLRRENNRLIQHTKDQQTANRVLQDRYNDEVAYTKALELKVDDLEQDMLVLNNRLK